MKKYAKLIAPNDNVVTCVSDVNANDTFIVKKGDSETEYKANQNVNFGHKIAIKEIKKGEEILKYGQVIGIASTDIKMGDWVHTHNVSDNYEVK